MKILKVKYTKDEAQGIAITDAKEVEMSEAVARIKLQHNNALRGGCWLSKEDFEKIYKQITEDDGNNENPADSKDRVDGGTKDTVARKVTRKSRKGRGVNESKVDEGT